MGYFDLKAVCTCCDKECGWNRYMLRKNSEWVCPSCFKIAVKLGLNVGTISSEELKEAIQNRVELINEKKEASSTGIVTSTDMYNYAKNNGFGRGMNEEWGIKHFKIISKNLMEGEDVLMTFIGLHNYRSATKHNHNFAYAITNKRFILAQKNAIAGEVFQTVYLDNINDITFSSGVAFGVMTIDTIRERFSVGLDKISAKKIVTEAHKILDDIRAKNKTQNGTIIAQLSPADEIKKYKNLLDEGIITEEEFNLKKSQLLGL